MALTDLQGRPYARRDTVKPGDYLVADGGFSCMKAGARKRVRTEEQGPGRRLYLACRWPGGSHRHYFDGQDDGDGGLVGLYPAEIFDGMNPAEIFADKAEPDADEAEPDADEAEPDADEQAPATPDA